MDDDREPDRRASIGDKLGLTPDRTAGRNLVQQKAVSTVRAAAARLDDYNVTKRKKKRKSSKKRKALSRRRPIEGKEEDQPNGYVPQSRESMALLKNTVELFDADVEQEEEEEDEESEGASMPPLLSGDEGGEGKDGKANGANLSVIVTPGPSPAPTKSDEDFIAPHNGSGGGDTQSPLPAMAQLPAPLAHDLRVFYG